jgi:hypothetical protein
MVAGVVYQQRMAWVECSHILGHRTRPPPQVAFAAVNVPSGRAAGICEPAGVGKASGALIQYAIGFLCHFGREWSKSWEFQGSGANVVPKAEGYLGNVGERMVNHV